MLDPIDSMIDDFVDGAETPDTNLKFTLTKDQLDKIKDTFKPLQFENNIQFELFSSGRVLVSSKDKAVDVWVELSTLDLDLHGEEYQSFYIDRNRINKFADVCSGSIEFLVKDGEMEVKIGTTDLHITLPIYELAIDVDYDVSESETLLSEVSENLCSRCFASKSTGPFSLATASLRDQWLYGSTESVSIVEGGFKSGLVLDVSSDFLNYIANLSFTKEEVKFIKDEERMAVVVTSNNVFYKTNLKPVPIEDVSPLLDEPSSATMTMETEESIMKLALLSIPLVGVDNAQFFIEHKDGEESLNISVRDESNKVSYDTWKVLKQSGEFSISLGINSYLSAVNAMEKTNLEVSVKETAVFLKDTGQTTILLAHM